MNEDSRKDTIMKVLAIAGFVAALILAVWLAVKLVAYIPDAFSSLASLADSVYNRRSDATLEISTNQTIVNNNESFTVTWTKIDRPGTYSFSYACADGVALDVRDDSNIVALECDTPLNLGSDATSIELMVASEKQRFTDIAYTVTFTPESGDAVVADNTFTVVNANIPQSADMATDEDGEAPAGDEVAVDDAPYLGAPDPAPAPAPTVIETPVYALPVSDPNGFVDLAVKFSGVGIMTDDQTFVRTAGIERDERGAFQFTVTNVGTKTSEEWEFTAELTSQETYDSPAQAPLRPNETAVITLGFDGVGEPGMHFFGAEIDVDGDRNGANDSFRWAVEVTD